MDRKHLKLGLEVWGRRSLAACAVLIAAVAGAYDAGTTYTVPAGTTVVVTDADIADFNTLAGATFGDANAVLEFNTSTPHAIPITGSGTIRKTSTATWAMTTPMPDFRGSYDIVAGVVSVNIVNPFGADSTYFKVTVYDGATLVLESHNKVPFRHIHLAGSGAAGRKGAVEMPAADFTTTDRYYFDLDADATLYGSGSAAIFLGGALNLNGRRLTITGSWRPTIMASCKVSTAGEVYLSKAAGAPTLYLRSWNHNNPAYQIAEGDGPFVLSGGTALSIWDGVKPVNRPIWLSGTNTLEHTSNNSSTHGYVTNHANWVGNILFTNETGLSVLKVINNVQSKYGQCMMVVSGPISGRGRVETKLNNSSNRVALLNSANSYTGGTYIDNSNADGSTLLGYPGTIPNEDYFSVTCNYGHVDLAVDENCSRWTYDAAARFLGAATFNSSSKPRFSSELADGGIGSMKLRLGAETQLTGFLCSKDAVRFEGDGNDTPVPFSWRAGTAILSGPSPMLLGDVKLRFDTTATATNSVVVFDGADATLHITNTFYIGMYNSKYAKVVVTNAVLKNSDVQKSNFGSGYDGLTGGSIYVGYYSPGILEVFDGAVISNRLIVCGYEPGGPWKSGGQGAVFQRGGHVVALGATTSYISSGVGMAQAAGTSGYYELLDGVLESRGRFTIGAYGYGCFAQYGGKVSITNRFGATSKGENFGMAYCNQGYGALYIKKGSWDLYTTDIQMGVGGTTRPTVDFTLDGDEASFDAHDTPIYVGIRSNYATYNFNFNGGVMRCGGIRRYSRYYNGTELLTNVLLCVNFNGGTFKAGSNGQNLFGYGATSDPALWATNVAVYAGGATIDTDGKTGSRLDTPIRGAWGKGVKSIALAEPIKGVNYISSPRVIITGDGFGASAFAHFDSTNMVVDRIVVTAPGCGYTSATGTIYYGQNVYKTLTSDAGEIVLEDNENTGTFTKAGEGDLTLYATNTWGGATVLKGGTLKAGCDWAVPTNSAVVLGGGSVLDLNGKAARISSLEYTAGGGSIVNASAAELPASFALRTTIEDVLADRAIALQGDQDLSGLTLTVEGDDYSALDKNAPRHRVLTVTGGRLVAAPNIVAAPPPAPWAYTVRPDGIILNYVKGSVFIMR